MTRRSCFLLDAQVEIKTDFIGFVGKVLLEKTLRCLPNIAYIYVLIR